MKPTLTIFAAVLAAVFGMMQPALPNHQMLFEKALALEDVHAKLPEAIALYQKVVNESGDKTLAAQAQLRIGMCHLKLGHKEAQAAFQKVIDDYSGQAETVRLAREQLSLLRRSQALVEGKDQEPTTRLVWSGPDAFSVVAPSPDGKHLSFVDWSSGDLALHDLETGKDRRLTNKGSWEQSSENALDSTWSPDGKQIAFQWENHAGHPVELRIMGLDGSPPRTLYSAGENEYAHLHGWSPDGKWILALLMPGRQLSLISVADGSIRALKTVESFGGTSFSPDGRYIVLDALQAGDPFKRDIFILSIEEKHEIPLVVHPANDGVLGWTPNGKAVLFASDRTGSTAIWTIPVADGRAQGTPRMIRTVTSGTTPLGFSRDGRFFYRESKDASDIYTVRLGPATGKVLGPPERIINRFEGSNSYPSYSPDGKHLAYCSQRRPGFWEATPGDVLGVVSMETGEEQEFSKGLREAGVRAITRPRWSPDGRSIAVYGFAKPAGGGFYHGIYVVDLQTGTVSQVLYSDDDFRVYPAGWSADGKSVIFFRFDTKRSLYHLVTRSIEAGSEKSLYELPESTDPESGVVPVHEPESVVPDLAVSPDFQRLCILTRDRGKKAFWIMKAAGGEARRLREFTERERPAWFTWAADGKYILFTMREDAAEWSLWRLSVDGGESELLGLPEAKYRADLSAHPDGRRIAFSGGPRGGAEIWVMENLLPREE